MGREAGGENEWEVEWECGENERGGVRGKGGEEWGQGEQMRGGMKRGEWESGVRGREEWEQREGSERAWEERRVEARGEGGKSEGRGVKENGDGEWGRE